MRSPSVLLKAKRDMSSNGKSKIPDILATQEASLLTAWVAELEAASLSRGADLREICAEFLRKIRHAVLNGRLDDIFGPEWLELREMLSGLSRARTLQGYTPTETATFVFSFKKPLFDQLRKVFASDPLGLVDDLWLGSSMIDKLGLWTTEVHQQTREEVIVRQQQEMLELSTPVVKLWDGILALPMIGTLDSSRTQVVMEALLAADRGDRLVDGRDHRHHGRPAGRHPGRPAPPQDRHRRPADGGRLHHQRDPPPDRPDDRPPRR